MRTTLLVVLCSNLAAVAPVRADSGVAPVVLIPAAEDDAHLGDLEELSRALAVELEQAGVPHLSAEDARAFFLARVSRNPQAVEQDVLDQLPALRTTIRVANTEGRYEDARRDSRRLMDIASQALEAIDRSEKHAKEAKKACVVLANFILMQGNTALARQQLRECHGRWPHVPPPDNLPNAIQQLMDEAFSQINDQTVTLHVSSTPSNCDAYVEGYTIGRTPRTITLPAGVARRVQVRCGEGPPGRVHLAPENEDVSIHVDTRLEGAVRTDEPFLHLQYDRLDTRTLRSHARTVGLALEQQSALAITRKSTNTYELHLVTSTHAAAIELTENYTPADLREAWSRLVHALHEATGAGVPAQDVAHVATPQDDEHSTGRTKLWAGLSLTVAGGTFIGLGWWRQLTRERDGQVFRDLPVDGDDLPPEYLSYADQWLKSRGQSYGLVATGAALAAAGLPLATLPATPQRWMVTVSAVSAASGAAMIGVGAYFVASGGPCDPERAPGGDSRYCSLDQERRDRGALLLLTSAPLLTLPLAHLARTLFGDQTTVAASAGPRRAHLALTARF